MQMFFYLVMQMLGAWLGPLACYALTSKTYAPFPTDPNSTVAQGIFLLSFLLFPLFFWF